MALAKLKADPFTRATLGTSGLEAVSRNLWLMDCQSCGRPLGPGSPALVVADTGATVTADLHHPECRQPAWTDTPSLTNAALLSHITRLVGLPMQHRDGTEELSATFVVNPSLESVYLVQDTAGEYRSGTVDRYRPVGLRPPGRELIVDRPVEGLAAWLTETDVIVQCGPATWSAPRADNDQSITESIRRRNGLFVAVTTALHPGMLDDGNQAPLQRILRTGEVAMGFVALADSDSAPRLDEEANSLTTADLDALDDDGSDLDWLPEVSPYEGPSYDPTTGRFRTGISMDGPVYWALNTPGRGVENGLITGPHGCGRTNQLTIVVLEALASARFLYFLADPSEANGLCDGPVAKHAKICARTVTGTIELFDVATRMIEARQGSENCYIDPSPKTPGFLLAIDDAQEVLGDRRAADLALRVAQEGPAVGIGLVVTSLAPDPEQFGGNRQLVQALAGTNRFPHTREQADTIQKLLADQ